LGEPGFLSGEDRNRTTYKFLGKITLCTLPATRNTTLAVALVGSGIASRKKRRISRVAERTTSTYDGDTLY
jgi:hypothetical protein